MSAVEELVELKTFGYSLASGVDVDANEYYGGLIDVAFHSAHEFGLWVWISGNETAYQSSTFPLPFLFSFSPDLAVGSFASQAVIVFRAHSVARLVVDSTALVDIVDVVIRSCNNSIFSW